MGAGTAWVVAATLAAAMGCGGDDGGRLADGGGTTGDGGASVEDDAATPVDAAPPTDAGPAMECVPGAECETLDATCETDTQRCACRTGAGWTWECEPLECPLELEAGEACSDPGLRCRTGFEDAGYLCVEDAGEWVRCYKVYWDGTGPRYWCPPEEPAVGDPCCVEYRVGGPPDDCPYGDAVYLCRGNQWTLAEG